MRGKIASSKIDDINIDPFCFLIIKSPQVSLSGIYLKRQSNNIIIFQDDRKLLFTHINAT